MTISLYYIFCNNSFTGDLKIINNVHLIHSQASRQCYYGRKLAINLETHLDLFYFFLTLSHLVFSIFACSAAAEKIRTDLKEHKERWSYIQRISDFNIELNPGKDYLELHLYGNGMLV